jgi:hypothetical protein
VYPVDKELLAQGPPEFNHSIPTGEYTYRLEVYRLVQSGNLDRLELGACIDEYAKLFQSTRSHLLLVSVGLTGVGFPEKYPVTFDQGAGLQPYRWVCNQYLEPSRPDCDNNLPRVRKNVSDWRPFGSIVEYCLSEPIEEHCKFRFSTTISWLVIGLNFLKFVLMCGVVFGVKEEPLMTIGDAISSFMRNPDPTTNNMCLAAKSEFTVRPRLWSTSPRRFVPTLRRRSAAVSQGQWITCIAMCVSY